MTATGAFDEMYLDEAMENLGEAFEYSSLRCGVSPDTFISLFVASDYAYMFAKGDPSVISGRSGTELARDIIYNTGSVDIFPGPMDEFHDTPEYWCGWCIALYQWASGRPFHNIMKRISMDDILMVYLPLHEGSEDRIVETIDSMVLSKEKDIRLKEMRESAGMTLDELSRKGGIDAQTLQGFEKRDQTINDASRDTLMALAKALGCLMEDLMEYPPVSLQR